MNPITFTIREEPYSVADHWWGFALLALAIILAVASTLYLIKHEWNDVYARWRKPAAIGLIVSLILGVTGIFSVGPTSMAQAIAKEAQATSGYNLRFLSDASFREDAKQTDLVVSLSKEGQREVKNCFLSTIPNRDVIHVIIDGCRAA